MDLVLPEDLTALEFDFRFEPPGDGDWLSATLNGEAVFNFRGENFVGDGFQTARIPASRFAGRVEVFELALRGAGEVDSEVLVSNLRAFRQPILRLAAVSKPDALIEVALSGEIGWTYDIEVSTNLVQWNVLTNLTLSQPSATARRTGLERLVLPGRRYAVGRQETVSGPSVTHVTTGLCRLRLQCRALPAVGTLPGCLWHLGGLRSTARDGLCVGIQVGDSPFSPRGEPEGADQRQGGDRPDGRHLSGSTWGLHLLLPSLQAARELSDVALKMKGKA